MSYSTHTKLHCTYNMDINKYNQQKCKLNNSKIKVNDISDVEKKHTCVGCFLKWRVCIQCAKEIQNQCAKARAHFKDHEE